MDAGASGLQKTRSLARGLAKITAQVRNTDQKIHAPQKCCKKSRRSWWLHLAGS
jgi:hypothetical protein